MNIKLIVHLKEIDCVNIVRALSFNPNRGLFSNSLSNCVPAKLTGCLFHLSTMVGEEAGTLLFFLFVPYGICGLEQRKEGAGRELDLLCYSACMLPTASLWFCVC